MHGQFVWYELTTPDVAAARRFYPPITGWGTQQFDKDYTMWTSGGVPFAGIFHLGPEQRQRGIPPNWMPYVEVDNVDESARRATSLGGKVVHGPEDIPGTGRFAVLQEPQGAVFGIYKSNTSSQSWNGTPVLGRFTWHELMTTDYKRAFDFYGQLFGWKKTSEMDMRGGETYFMYGMKGTPFGGMFNRPAEMAQVPPFWLCYVHVKDVKKAVETATRAGATLQRGPMDVSGGVIAILSDPQGAAFALHHAATKAVSAPTSTAKKTSKAASRPKAKATRSRARAKAKAGERPAAKEASRRANTKSKRRDR